MSSSKFLDCVPNVDTYTIWYPGNTLSKAEDLKTRGGRQQAESCTFGYNVSPQPLSIVRHVPAAPDTE
jgi:hypothetical protein